VNWTKRHQNWTNTKIGPKYQNWINKRQNWTNTKIWTKIPKLDKHQNLTKIPKLDKQKPKLEKQTPNVLNFIKFNCSL
jgi:hypothetical protein